VDEVGMKKCNETVVIHDTPYISLITEGKIAKFEIGNIEKDEDGVFFYSANNTD